VDWEAEGGGFEDYEGREGRENGDSDEQLSLDHRATIAARGIIKSTGVEDTTEIWRALKRAYLAGYGAAER
jgi:hypothetical protein